MWGENPETQATLLSQDTHDEGKIKLHTTQNKKDDQHGLTITVGDESRY